ncbi:MAG: winged helix-turn-helix domain-containing protein [Acidobacteriota bacterium]
MDPHDPQRRRIGDYEFDRTTGQLQPRGAPAESGRRLEPKVAALLELLANRAGELVTKEEVTAALWPDVVVGEDALPRCLSKLRRALGDDAKSPRYVETVPKRGYRLIARVGGPSGKVGPVEPVPPSPARPEAATGSPTKPRRSPPATWILGLGVAAALVAVLLAASFFGQGRRSNESAAAAAAAADPAERLVEQADDYYIHITRRGNESAIELYEQALAADPEHPRAHAGLANALVQRVLRYPGEPAPELDTVNLGSALAAGRLATPAARDHLQRALGLAERSVRLDPTSASAHKALGFVTSALGRLDDAEDIYARAVELDPDAWDVWLNLGDIHGIRGDDAEALRSFELAYAAMERVWDEQRQRVTPWLGELGAAIGELHGAAGRSGEAEVWYRRVLAYAPFHPRATCGLASLLRDAGDAGAAGRLEVELSERLGDGFDCRTPGGAG